MKKRLIRTKAGSYFKAKGILFDREIPCDSSDSNTIYVAGRHYRKAVRALKEAAIIV